MKIDYPESFIAEFPPQMAFGHYDLDLVPANATQAEVTFIVTSRAATGGEAVASFVWKLDVPREWRLQAGQEWKGAEESTRTDEEINPGVAAHGGRVSLVDVQGTNVVVRMGGGCQGCGQADVTLREGVVSTLTRRIPEIGEVLDATDHAAGENPYY